jgi:hypothetical protein
MDLQTALEQSGFGDAEILVADDLDDAVLGITLTEPRRLIYDYARVIDILVAKGLDREEAEEFADFNITDAYVGPQTPIFVSRHRDW